MAPLGHVELTKMQKLLKSKNKNKNENSFLFSFYFSFSFLFSFSFSFSFLFLFSFSFLFLFSFSFFSFFLVFIFKFYYGTSRPPYQLSSRSFKTRLSPNTLLTHSDTIDLLMTFVVDQLIYLKLHIDQ